MRRLELPIESPHTDRLALRHVNILHLVREGPARLPTEDPHDLEGRSPVNLQPLNPPVAVFDLQSLLQKEADLLLLETEDRGGGYGVLSFTFSLDVSNNSTDLRHVCCSDRQQQVDSPM